MSGQGGATKPGLSQTIRCSIAAGGHGSCTGTKRALSYRGLRICSEPPVGGAGTIPILPPLQAAIDASNIGQLTYLVTAFGKPFCDAGIGNWFRERCDEAGPYHCGARCLRKAGATIALDLGASDEQLMALFGWRSRRQVSTYTRGANQKRLAHGAGSRIAAALKMNGIVPLSGTVES